MLHILNLNECLQKVGEEIHLFLRWNAKISQGENMGLTIRTFERVFQHIMKFGLGCLNSLKTNYGIVMDIPTYFMMTHKKESHLLCTTWISAYKDIVQTHTCISSPHPKNTNIFGFRLLDLTMGHS